jgi:signal transduction histidine kinase
LTGNERPPQLVDLNATIFQVQDIFQEILGENVVLRTKLAPNLGLVHGERRKIEALLVNLFLRARDAAPPAGELTVITSNLDLDTAAAAGMNVSPGPYAQLQFRVSRQVEPGGIREKLEQLHGAIDVKKTSDGGFTVIVALPRAS